MTGGGGMLQATIGRVASLAVGSATAADVATIVAAVRGALAAHAAAARLAIDAGFDAVEIHLGHNYLASSFLSPLINRRTDSFGGSLENRARVVLETARSVRDAVGDLTGHLLATARIIFCHLLASEFSRMNEIYFLSALRGPLRVRALVLVR